MTARQYAACVRMETRLPGRRHIHVEWRIEESDGSGYLAWWREYRAKHQCEAMRQRRRR